MNNFNNLFINFKNPKTKKTETQLKKELIMKNVDELYKNYYDTYKSDYDTNDELTEDKKKKFNYKQFETHHMISKEPKPTGLPKWLKSRNDFSEAIKLINNIRADANRIRSSSGNEKVFNDLNKLINDIQNNKIKRKDAVERIRNIVSNSDQQRQKKVLFFKTI